MLPYINPVRDVRQAAPEREVTKAGCPARAHHPELVI
jgi:hypothetical protein